MRITHAPYAIIGDLSIVYGKTTKTACGVRRQTRALVSRDSATCPKCIAQIAVDRAEFASMEQSAIDAGLISREQLDRAPRMAPWRGSNG